MYSETRDGVRLHGWLAEPDGGSPRAVVLFNHGNGRNVTTRRHVIELFRDRMNTTVLVYDYRGYGKSTGRPTETGVLTDARAARRWLAARAGVRESDVVIAGHSLGTGVAVDLAAADGARGLILEGAFTSLPDVAASHVPFLPVRAVMQTRLHSEAKIAAYHGPLLQVHGDGDGSPTPRVAAVRGGERAEAVRDGAGGDHNHLYTPEFVEPLTVLWHTPVGTERPRVWPSCPRRAC